jgi:DNA-binding response OmpR family regulator
VLVVDDDPMVSMAIEFCLQRQGFEVTLGESILADRGHAGIDALRGTDFDMMVINLFEPLAERLEPILVFRDRAGAIPVVAMFGRAQAMRDASSSEFLRRTLDLGASKCLRKPFTPAALLAAVGACLPGAAPPVSAIKD